MTLEIPKELYVHLYVTEYSTQFSYHYKELNGNGFVFLFKIPVEFPEFDLEATARDAKLQGLKSALGEAQAKVDFIKDQIQKHLAIGHEEPIVDSYRASEAPQPEFDKFDDDIPF